MIRGSRPALAVLVLATLLAPVATIHPAIAHLYAAGLSNVPIEVSHPAVVWGVALAVVAGLPACGLLLSLFLTARSLSELRALKVASYPAKTGGLSYRVLPWAHVTVFTAGPMRPTLFVSEGARRTLTNGEFRAALLHEQAHQRDRDVLWLLLLRAIGRAFPFLSWLRTATETEAIWAECKADEYALQRGAGRLELFNAIAAASAPSNQSAMAGIAGADVELRLTRLVHPETPLPLRPTRAYLSLAGGVALPVLVSHIAALATLCSYALR